MRPGRRLRSARRGVGPRGPAIQRPGRLAGPRSIPPRPAGPRRSPIPSPRRPSPPHLASEAPGGGEIGRKPQAAALGPTDSVSSALPAHGACAERGGVLPPILTRGCTPAHWLLDAPTGLWQSTGVCLCPNKRALTPNQDCWACPKKQRPILPPAPFAGVLKELHLILDSASIVLVAV